MIDKKLVVEIPKKYEKGLRRRFDLRRLHGIRYIEEDCPLCRDFQKKTYSGRYLMLSCKGCPFEKFSLTSFGCINWLEELKPDYINTLVLTYQCVYVRDKSTFKTLKDKAKKYIKFV